jgi:heme/copper-type cytochrome/quinol oxidase subunit 2
MNKSIWIAYLAEISDMGKFLFFMISFISLVIMLLVLCQRYYEDEDSSDEYKKLTASLHRFAWVCAICFLLFLLLPSKEVLFMTDTSIQKEVTK